MAEGQNNNGEQNNDQGNGNQGGTDYKAMYEQMKAESRKWEDRAKANKEKADKWDAASGGDDSIEDRIAALEAENKAMKDAEARHALVAKVAAATGLSASIVESLSGSDEDTLTEQAKAIAELKPKGAPKSTEAGKFPHKKEAEDGADAEKRKWVRQLFGEE